GSENSVIVPPVVMRPIFLASISVNQSAPSGPATIPRGLLAEVGVGNSIMFTDWAESAAAFPSRRTARRAHLQSIGGHFTTPELQRSASAPKREFPGSTHKVFYRSPPIREASILPWSSATHVFSYLRFLRCSIGLARCSRFCTELPAGVHRAGCQYP